MKHLIAIVGMKHRPGMDAFVAGLPLDEPLTLVREPTNQYDANAVQVWARGNHVGYLKASQVGPVALAMDAIPNPAEWVAIVDPRHYSAGESLTARLKTDGGRWPMAEVEV